MPELEFRISGARAVPHTAAPLLGLEVEISNRPETQPLRGILLRCQLRIDPHRLKVTPEQAHALRHVFGEGAIRARSLSPLLWQTLNINVPPFSGATRVELEIPCSPDLELVPTKIFRAIDAGHVPIGLLFSGTVFYGELGALQVTQLPWSSEAWFDLPVDVWRSVLDQHLGARAVLPLDRALIDRLYRYRMDNDVASWDQAVSTLLDAAERDAAARCDAPEPPHA
jgi:hypothetical protein